MFYGPPVHFPLSMMLDNAVELALWIIIIIA